MAGKPGRSGTNGQGKNMCFRSRHQRELDRAEMVRLLARGWTMQMIADKIGVHYTQISYDWKIVKKEIVSNRDMQTDFLIAQKLSEYAEIKREAWDAWELSKKEAESYTLVETVEMDGDGCEKITKVKKGRLPETNYLKVILDCMEAERELQGLNPTKELHVSGTMVNWDVLAGGIPSGPIPDTIEEELRRAALDYPPKVIEALPDEVNNSQEPPNSPTPPSEQTPL